MKNLLVLCKYFCNFFLMVPNREIQPNFFVYQVLSFVETFYIFNAPRVYFFYCYLIIWQRDVIKRYCHPPPHSRITLRIKNDVTLFWNYYNLSGAMYEFRPWSVLMPHTVSGLWKRIFSNNKKSGFLGFYKEAVLYQR